MKKQIEAFKIEFLKNLEDSDFRLVCSYEKIETCIEIICLRDLVSRKTKFKFFQLTGTVRILIQADKKIMVEYVLIQNGKMFELYEMNFSAWKKYEIEYCLRF